MRARTKLFAPLAVVAVAALAGPASTALADSGSTTYSATLNQINHSGGSGMLTLTLTGSTARIQENWTGLAANFGGAPYPHVQHIHIGAQGVCPSTAADTNHDGVISTTEGASAYGAIGTTLSVKGDTSPAAGTNIKIAPSGPSTNYARTITLDSKTIASIKAGTAVIVVHGLDPSTLSKQAQKEKSDLVPSLPLAATSPALCGSLNAMPVGAPQTGSGSTQSIEHEGLFGLGGGLLVGAAGVAIWARRRTDKATDFVS